mgnify:CR=1 FL=1
MKRVIDGKIYDTATATCIGETEFGTSGDHKYCHEALFKTSRGRYFLEYHGGPLSRYAVDRGPHLVSGSSGLRLLDNDEALGWCEAAEIDPDTIARHFTLEEG